LVVIGTPKIPITNEETQRLRVMGVENKSQFIVDDDIANLFDEGTRLMYAIRKGYYTIASMLPESINKVMDTKNKVLRDVLMNQNIAGLKYLIANGLIHALDNIPGPSSELANILILEDNTDMITIYLGRYSGVY